LLVQDNILYALLQTPVLCYDLIMKWIKHSLLFHIFLLVVASAIGYASFPMVKQALALYRESAGNRAKIAELKQKKRELEQYLEYIQSPGAIVEQARERLNLKLSGEQVVVVITQRASSTQERAELTGRKFWEWLARWRDWFR